MGIYGPEAGVLAIIFHQMDAPHSGVFLLHARPDGREGTWAFSGSSTGRLGTERWIAR